MLVKSILRTIVHYKGFVIKEVTWDLNKSVLLVDIQPRRGSLPCCSVCGKKCSTYDHLKPRRFQFVPLWGYAVFLVYALGRVNYPTCKVKVVKIPWSDGKQQTTYTFRIFLATWAKRLSWKETASIFGTSWDTVFRAIQWVVHWGIVYREISEVNAIGIDEIQYRKGHNYLTMVYQIDKNCRRLLYVARERTEGSLRGFFSVMSKETFKSLRYVCSDMWPAYLSVIKESVPKATHVLDRFHVMRKISEKIDRVRAQEVRQLKQDGYEPILTQSRWCLLKRPENLTDSQSLKLQELLKYNLKSVKAYLMREDFQRFWLYFSGAWAEKFLEQWCARTKQSRIGPMQDPARTLLKHKALILSCFSADGEISNGIVEGFNNKAKLAMRKAYGFKSYEKIEIALYHQLGSLPEPESTHRFC